MDEIMSEDLCKENPSIIGIEAFYGCTYPLILYISTNFVHIH